MFRTDNFKKALPKTNQYNFNEKALELFHFQAVHNKVYAKYLKLLKRDPGNIKNIENIPFLPIGLFKNNKIVSSDSKEEALFESSGTTGSLRSKHYVLDVSLYKNLSLEGFERLYGSIKHYTIVALLPSYLENPHSSLLYMVHHFIAESKNPLSGFVTDKEISSLSDKVAKSRLGGKKILLIGVTYALLDLAREGIMLEDVIVMETGGMKGRGEEQPREAVHNVLKKAFGVSDIHSEYGMTELLSQSYARSGGIFMPPPWKKIYIREINDPFNLSPSGTAGGINIIDLANVDSCAFIATEDLGKLGEAETFHVIGRIDNTETRGCNQLLF